MRRVALGLVVAVVAGCAGRSAVTSAERVDACEHAHGMTSAHVHVSRPGGVDAGGGETFKACSWPPAAGADADGYSEAVTTMRQGPGEKEASDSNVVDEVGGTCHRFRVRYLFGLQGETHLLAPLVVRPGELVTAYGKRWTGQLPFYPAPDVAEVVHNGSVVVVAASCAA